MLFFGKTCLPIRWGGPKGSPKNQLVTVGNDVSSKRPLLKEYTMAAQDKIMIEDVEGLDALPEYAVVRDAPLRGNRAHPFEKLMGRWAAPGVEEDFSSSELRLPAQLLYLPED